MPQMTDELPSSTRPRTPPHLPSAVSLVGFMGAGKTTIGQALAAKLGWRFVDLDDLIVKRGGRTIPEIFQQDGEVAFRDLEQQLLQQAIRPSQAGGAVLSLGGGAFIDNTNQRLLRENEIPAGVLEGSAEKVVSRCVGSGAGRALFYDRKWFFGV